jgi:hypothetical protein
MGTIIGVEEEAEKGHLAGEHVWLEDVTGVRTRFGLPTRLQPGKN